MDLSGKLVLITGCDSPGTREIAGRFALAGSNLIVQYQKEEKEARSFAEKINLSGGKASAIYADLGSSRDAERMTAEIAEAGHTIDILVNDIKHHSQIPFRELTSEQWNESLQQNLFPIYHISRCVGNSMTERGKGVIINITSAIHFSGLGGGVDFSSAEAAVHGMTLAMARELSSKGIRVNAIAPALGYYRNQDTVGDFAVFLSSSLAGNISGEIFKLDGFPVRKEALA